MRVGGGRGGGGEEVGDEFRMDNRLLLGWEKVSKLMVKNVIGRCFFWR